MNRKIFFIATIVYCLFFIENIFGQSWQWAKAPIGLSSFPFSEGLDVAVDDSGNVIILGSSTTNEKMVFENGNTNDTVNSLTFILAKLHPNGDFSWAVCADSSNNWYFDVLTISTDQYGNVYAAGDFEFNPLILGPYTLVNDSPSTSAFGQMFLVKYDRNGNLQWAKNIGSPGAFPYDIVSDSYGNIFIVGGYNAPHIVFGTTTFNSTSFLPTFFLKVNVNGNVSWAKSFLGLYGDDFSCVTIDQNDNPILGGNFSAPLIAFDSDTLTNVGGDNTFLTKYDSSGNVIWATCSQGSAFTKPVSVTTDPAGEIFNTGIYHGTNAIFGSDTLWGNDSTTYTFTAKYNSSGIPQWVRKGDGTQPYSITADNEGSAYISEGCQINIDSVVHADTLMFDSFPIYFKEGSKDPMYFVKYDSDGNVVCGTSLTSGGDDQNAIVDGGNGNIYIVGDFFETQFIVGNDTFIRDSMQGLVSENLFVAKYNCDIAEEISPVKEISNFNIFPNPTNDLVIIYLNGNSSSKNLQLFNSLGQKLRTIKITREKTEIDVSNFSSGIYYIKIISSDGKSEVRKLVVLH